MAEPAAKITVLFAVPTLQGGGAERVITTLANHLDRNRFRPVLAVGKSGGAYSKHIRKDVQLVELGQTRAAHSLFPLLRVVRAIKPDVLLTTLGFNLTIGFGWWLFPRRSALIAREGNTVSAFIADIQRTSTFRARLYRGAYTHAYRRLDAVVCQSQAMQHDLIFSVTGGNLRNSYLIHNPVDTDYIEQKLGTPQTVDRRLPRGTPTLIAVGKLEQQKGFDLLLKAFVYLQEKHPAAKLSIVGEGPERRQLELLRSQLGLSNAVYFHGFVPDPFDLVQQADVFVSASRYEGLPNVVLESLACGTPVVATDCPGGTREIVCDDGIGLLCPPNDVDQLALTLVNAVDKAEFFTADKLRAYVTQHFGVDTIIRKYEQLISDTLQRCNSQRSVPAPTGSYTTTSTNDR